MSHCLKCGGEIVGRRSDAKYCSRRCAQRTRNKQYATVHPDRIRASRSRHKLKIVPNILARVKHRAKKRGIPFNLEPTDITIPALCPVLGLPLKRNIGGKGYHPCSPSIDRVVPAAGYIKGNVRVISARANLLKNDASIAELEAVLKDLRILYA